MFQLDPELKIQFVFRDAKSETKRKRKNWDKSGSGDRESKINKFERRYATGQGCITILEGLLRRSTRPSRTTLSFRRAVRWSRQICACKSLINDNQQVLKGQRAVRLESKPFAATNTRILFSFVCRRISVHVFSPLKLDLLSLILYLSHSLSLSLSVKTFIENWRETHHTWLASVNSLTLVLIEWMLLMFANWFVSFASIKGILCSKRIGLSMKSNWQSNWILIIMWGDSHLLFFRTWFLIDSILASSLRVHHSSFICSI